jgi:two-component system chemotaxis response regulator CheB
MAFMQEYRVYSKRYLFAGAVVHGGAGLEKLKVLIAESSVLNRKKIADAVASTEYGMVAHTASNGQIAMEWLQHDAIDVVMLDSLLVNEIGLHAFEGLRRVHPHVEIILLSRKDPESAAMTLEALNHGALDFAVKPDHEEERLWETVFRSTLESIFAQIQVRQFLPLHGTRAVSPVAGPDARQAGESLATGQSKGFTHQGGIDLIVITSSTGGPVALDTLFRRWPSPAGCPVLVVQHMPPGFTGILADSLEKKHRAGITEGVHGDALADGRILIAPGGFHMILSENGDRKKMLRLTESAYVNGVRPAADLLFESVAEHYRGRNILAVILTGMGNDGTQGVRMLKDACNCYCITQSESSCVVYGMPKCVVDAGLSDEAVHLESISGRIGQIVKGER